MAFENMDVTEDTGGDVEPAGGPPEESSNRTFIIIAIVMGGILLLSIVCIGIIFGVSYLPKLNAQRSTQAAKNTAQAALVALSSTQTAEFVQRPTVTATRPAPTNTSVPPTNTPVVAPPQPQTSPTVDPRTATVAALLTQAAAAQLTPTRPTSTLLPVGGFADDMRTWGMGLGIPGLLGLAVVFIAIIFLARKLRHS